jgi:GDP-mannose 6-dehydrogenase
MKISIFGLGYVGCVSMGCLAKNGHTLVGVDINSYKVELINNGKPTIIEKEIDILIEKYHKKGQITATENYMEAVLNTDMAFICVGTPSLPTGQLNLEYVFNTARQIGEALKEKTSFFVIAIRSTVFPGTNANVVEIVEQISGKKANIDFAVVSNPEFLREGSAVEDYYNPALTVVGAENEKAIEMMHEVYAEIDAPFVATDIRAAEMIKYVNNAFHALKISFANEVGNIAKAIGVDAFKVMELFKMDNRLNISPAYFNPGMAYGGSCLPKDLKGLSTISHDNYIKAPVMEAIGESNELQKQRVIDIIEKKGKRKVGLLGLAFKKGTDDLRFSPSVVLAESLLGKGYSLKVYDKNVHLAKVGWCQQKFY